MSEYLRVRVSLLTVPDGMWRRFLIRRGASFLELHEAIQDACGWKHCHLFAFQKAGSEDVIASMPIEDMEYPRPGSVSLASFFRAGGPMSCIYVYDFGDFWEHEVVVEGTEQLKEKFRRRLIDGAMAFPPEDCGSGQGYQRCVAALTGDGWEILGRGYDRKELLEWIGDWRPDSFELSKVKRAFDW